MHAWLAEKTLFIIIPLHLLEAHTQTYSNNFTVEHKIIVEYELLVRTFGNRSHSRTTTSAILAAVTYVIYLIALLHRR